MVATTQVSPYNGLASVTILVMLNHVNGLQSGRRLGIGRNWSRSAIFVLSFVLQFSLAAMSSQEVSQSIPQIEQLPTFSFSNAMIDRHRVPDINFNGIKT